MNLISAFYSLLLLWTWILPVSSGTSKATACCIYGYDSSQPTFIESRSSENPKKARYDYDLNGIALQIHKTTWNYTYDASGIHSGHIDGVKFGYPYEGSTPARIGGMYYLRARYYKPDLGRFWTMDSYEGNNQDPASLHKYLYCLDNPVNMTDPNGHDGELGSQLTTVGGMESLASQGLGAVSRAYVNTVLRMPQIMDGASRVLFWTEFTTAFIGATAVVAPEVLNTASSLAERINRACSLNSTPIPSAPGGPNGYGVTIENVGGRELEAMGGRYLGGNVKGIDGTLGVGPGNVLVSFKAHDVSQENLISTINRDMKRFADLNPAEIQGTANNGQRFPPSGGLGPVAGKIKVIAVPLNRAQYIISPQFIEAMRNLAEETKTIPIIRAVRNWRGRN